jgi:hypothetical protein
LKTSKVGREVHRQQATDYARKKSETRCIAKRDRETATAMFIVGMAIKTICKYTGLPPEEVNF